MRLHIVPALGRTRLSAPRAESIQTLYANKLSEGLAPLTVKKITEGLHRAMEMAVQWNFLVRNPADNADKPAVPRRQLTTLGPYELNRPLESATTEAERTNVPAQQQRAAKRWAVLWIVAIHTGLREAELPALTRDDVDIERSNSTVRRNLVSIHRQRPQFGEPISQTSRRTVSQPASMVQALRTHTAHQAEDRLATDYWAPFNLVFCNHVGTLLLRRNLLRAFNVALARAGLPETVHFS